MEVSVGRVVATAVEEEVGLSGVNGGRGDWRSREQPSRERWRLREF
jgi:hypothetical protein